MAAEQSTSLTSDGMYGAKNGSEKMMDANDIITGAHIKAATTPYEAATSCAIAPPECSSSKSSKCSFAFALANSRTPSSASLLTPAHKGTCWIPQDRDRLDIRGDRGDTLEDRGPPARDTISTQRIRRNTRRWLALA